MLKFTSFVAAAMGTSMALSVAQAQDATPASTPEPIPPISDEVRTILQEAREEGLALRETQREATQPVRDEFLAIAGPIAAPTREEISAIRNNALAEGRSLTEAERTTIRELSEANRTAVREAAGPELEALQAARESNRAERQALRQRTAERIREVDPNLTRADLRAAREAARANGERPPRPERARRAARRNR